MNASPTARMWMCETFFRMCESFHLTFLAQKELSRLLYTLLSYWKFCALSETPSRMQLLMGCACGGGGGCRRLAAAANRGDLQGAEEAEAVLAEMEAAGLPPGPRAYHVLIFAYTQAGAAGEAWGATMRAIRAGASLLQATFEVLIHGYVRVRPQP